ncbi:MAG: hypothetical protein ABR987_06355 [Terracidiphilus sp.]|jgi:hypothetical protein
MVELSEKLVRPSLGALTGFVSASSGTVWETTPFRASATLLASFVAQGNCVKQAYGEAGFTLPAGRLRNAIRLKLSLPGASFLNQ